MVNWNAVIICQLFIFQLSFSISLFRFIGVEAEGVTESGCFLLVDKLPTELAVHYAGAKKGYCDSRRQVYGSKW